MSRWTEARADAARAAAAVVRHEAARSLVYDARLKYGEALEQSQAEALIDEQLMAVAREAMTVNGTGHGKAPTFAMLAELLARPDLLAAPETIIPRLAHRGRLTILAGPDKSGKSTLAGHAIAAHSRRGYWLGERCGGDGRAVLVGLEEAVGDAVRRLLEVGADPERLQLLVMPQPDLLAQTRALLADWPADVVVVDSLSEYARVTMGTVPDDGDSAGWAAVVRPLVALAREYNCAVLLLHHVRRSDGQYRGSSEIAAAADCLLELAPPNTGEDPNLRRIRGRARWSVEPFAVALNDGRYELAGGAELAVDTRALLFVERTPGASRNAVRKGVGGRASVVDAAIGRLVNSGALEDRGKGGRMALYAASGQTTMEEL
jgi:hypothetical protein